MQIDFGEAQVYLKNKLVKVSLFCMRLKYSSVPIVIAFPTQRLEAFLEGHNRAFAYFGVFVKRACMTMPLLRSLKSLKVPNEKNTLGFPVCGLTISLTAYLPDLVVETKRATLNHLLNMYVKAP